MTYRSVLTRCLSVIRENKAALCWYLKSTNFSFKTEKELKFLKKKIWKIFFKNNIKIYPNEVCNLKFNSLFGGKFFLLAFLDTIKEKKENKIIIFTMSAHKILHFESHFHTIENLLNCCHSCSIYQRKISQNIFSSLLSSTATMAWKKLNEIKHLVLLAKIILRWVTRLNLPQ